MSESNQPPLVIVIKEEHLAIADPTAKLMQLVEAVAIDIKEEVSDYTKDTAL